MLAFPHIDPVIVHLGPLQVRWYGLMYVLGFTASWLLVSLQIRRHGLTELARHFENLNLTLILSLVAGGRLGYVLFYNLPYYLENPLEIPATWQGGMSFHGALIGMVLGGLIFCRVTGLPFWQCADVYFVTTPIGLGLGRIGNFLNGELYGRVSDLPWAMVFPAAGPLPRHPSQLYEAGLEGVLLFAFLWAMQASYWRNHWPAGSLTALFLIGYGLCRVAVELVREPDAQLGFVIGSLTMGQLLSFAMLAAGLAILLLRRNQEGAPA
ncbi:MAG: prolipoprotein diacylglyceryl transferase [Thermodesulfobacteriota bacterium]